ncbi:hypothetical protein IWW36_002525 [Coemansia brasiliensis]|uniref:RRM domain-containing protein n=1 Tax=Coemansia brasiliensis TaxID=2650707 RepID=A0A9W8M0K2_9FUNG|nr:hypothetical protein IWW36_002525 [Coemansia brasiliensis]
MFNLLKASVVRSSAVRSFCTRSVYVSNVSPSSTIESLTEVFSKFGKVNGVRINVAGNSFRFAHVYFYEGQLPEAEGSQRNFWDMRATPEEKESVENSINQATGLNGTDIDGHTVGVYEGRKKNQRNSGVNSDMAEKLDEQFKKGYTDGYRQGFLDGKNSS